jgi:hypothetical protein
MAKLRRRESTPLRSGETLLDWPLLRLEYLVLPIFLFVFGMANESLIIAKKAPREKCEHELKSITFATVYPRVKYVVLGSLPYAMTIRNE